MTLHRGEILGIAGLLGAGRTRLLRAIFGLEPVRSGRIRVGVYSGPASPRGALARRAWACSARTASGEGLALGLSIADNLTLSRLDGLGPGVLVLPSRQDGGRAPLDRAARHPQRAGRAQAVGELSGGNQQKVALARLLHHDVDVLVLDEPTRGIDVGSKAQIYALIDELVAGRPDGRADGDPVAAKAVLHGQQLPAGAARALRSHRGDVPRPARTGAAGVGMDGARAADGSVGRAAPS